MNTDKIGVKNLEVSILGIFQGLLGGGGIHFLFILLLFSTEEVLVLAFLSLLPAQGLYDQ